MRENRLSGSEGGGAQAALPTPIVSTEEPADCCFQANSLDEQISSPNGEFQLAPS